MVFSADIQLLKLRYHIGTDVFKLIKAIAMVEKAGMMIGN
jgi:hypothetical protein